MAVYELINFHELTAQLGYSMPNKFCYLLINIQHIYKVKYVLLQYTKREVVKIRFFNNISETTINCYFTQKTESPCIIL